MEIKPLEVTALIVHQWLYEWNKVNFVDNNHRKKPESHFYIFSLPAKQIRLLSKVYQRKADKPRAQDTSIQRSLEKNRVEEIGRFIHGGFPWSELNTIQKKNAEYLDLRMPGWLPTAIVANILPVGAIRDGKLINPENTIKIDKIDNLSAKITLPSDILLDSWNPEVPPLEIIDGQHRIYSFDINEKLDGNFDLPIVAFYDLDFTWQAYLFYTINIKPKKINTSLAYDLYPLLRIQDWLEKSSDGPMIYRETRAQELTEVLWSHPQSPWKNRINMVGGHNKGDVTQAAFIRSLTASFIKRGNKIGGLFASELHRGKNDVLPWSRIKQAAFLITIWQGIKEAINRNNDEWAKDLRGDLTQQRQFSIDKNTELDLAFSGPQSLLATDQGVRGILHIFNDMCYIASDSIQLTMWDTPGIIEDDLDFDQISDAIDSLRKNSIYEFIVSISKDLATFDWRTSSTPGLSDEKRRAQMVFKGSSGYKELREQLKALLCNSRNILIADTARRI